VVAADILSSELHKLPSGAWITMSEIEQTQAFANSAFGESPKSVDLFQKGVEELDQRNIIRRHARDATLLQWKRPSYRHQFALCADDSKVKGVFARANANLKMKLAAALKKEAAESVNADADLLEAQKRLAALSRKKKPAVSGKKKPAVSGKEKSAPRTL
jgi:hypothetical protein